MKKWKHKWIALCWMALPFSGFSQDTLTLSNAIDRALKVNYDIEVSRNNVEIASNNNHAGNAGMLPNVNLNIGDTPANSNIKQEFTNGTSIIRDGVFSNNFQASIGLNWTLFDGGRMFATRDRLNALQQQSESLLKAQIQNTLSEVMQAYHRIALQQDYMKVLEQLKVLSESRYAVVKTSLDAGLANNSDLYLAELDRTARLQSIASQEVEIANSYRDLNTLLNFSVDTLYAVQPIAATTNALDRATLDVKFGSNPEILAAGDQTDIALKSEKEWKAAMLPRVGLTASYGYSLAQSQAGFSLYNQNYGPQATLSVSVPLFTGNVNKRNYQNAIVAHESAELREQQTVATLRNQYEKAWNLYTTLQSQVALDESSVKTTSEYLKIMESRYKLGQSTVLEYREAQRSYEDIQYRLINNRYLLKLAETDLLRLTGMIGG